MKILLTVVVCGKVQPKPEYDGLEYIYQEENESEKDFIARAFKSAKGKYAIICTRDFVVADVQPLLNIIDKNTADMVFFAGGEAFKVSIGKNVSKNCVDAFSCHALCVLNCKSFLKTVYTPFAFGKQNTKLTEESAAGILYAAEAFGKVKAKLNKEIYSLAFNMLCDRLINYYLYAILAIRNGGMSAEELFRFDNKLKAEIVLYLALEQRFTAGKLQKLREKNFKISGFKAKKFAKLLK